MSRDYSRPSLVGMSAIGVSIILWAISPDDATPYGVTCTLLAAVSVLAAVGIRYPLQVLPILLFEIIWKSIWLISVELPLWSVNRFDTRTSETVRDCLVAVILIPLIPWRHVILNT